MRREQAAANTIGSGSQEKTQAQEGGVSRRVEAFGTHKLRQMISRRLTHGACVRRENLLTNLEDAGGESLTTVLALKQCFMNFRQSWQDLIQWQVMKRRIKFETGLCAKREKKNT